ncbi:MAG: hypothetical protein JWL71_3424 [Acidobacteria bacterium]|jgi:uncharacterized protein YjgD (DUF1641 family)|nr:hypothetical protein [Acidobacteriota bacterium]
MAQPIRFDVPPPDSRAVLRERVERAPQQHADAVLAAYDLLQALHDRGILDVTRSALAASDELLEQAVDAVKTPAAMRALRNLVFWQGILGSIEPKWFKGLVQAVPDGLEIATAERDHPVRPWTLLRRALSKDSLRGLAAAVDFLESFGRHLHMLERENAKGASLASRAGEV